MPRLELPQLNLPDRHLHTLQALLSQWVPDAEVWAYGSRVTGGAHECSDLNLVLRNPSDLSAEVEGWLDFKEALQHSLLPILVETHLWSLLPREFHANIEESYVVVQEGNKGRS